MKGITSTDIKPKYTAVSLVVPNSLVNLPAAGNNLTQQLELL